MPKSPLDFLGDMLGGANRPPLALRAGPDYHPLELAARLPGGTQALSSPLDAMIGRRSGPPPGDELLQAVQASRYDQLKAYQRQLAKREQQQALTPQTPDQAQQPGTPGAPPAAPRRVGIKGRAERLASGGEVLPGFQRPAPPPQQGPAPGAPQATLTAGDPRLGPHLERINRTAAEMGIHPAYLAAAVLQESGGDPNIVNAIGATGLLQALPGQGRGGRHSVAQLRDPDFNLQLAIPDFQRAAAEADTLGRRLGWRVDDPIERGVWIIARAQRYGGNRDGAGPAGYTNPRAPAHEPFRQYVRQLYNQTTSGDGGYPPWGWGPF